MEIHIRTLAFILLSLLGSVSLPFWIGAGSDGQAANTTLQALPTPTLVPLRGLSAQTQGLAVQLRQSTPATAEAGATLSSITATVNTNGANLNIRIGPGLDHAIVGSAPVDTVLTVTGISADSQWMQIQPPQGGGRGWVYAALTTIDGEPQTLPVVGEE